MFKSITLDIVAFGVLVAFASPAFAGTPVTPAPIAGVGIGAIALIGVGYRALKRRAKR